LTLIKSKTVALAIISALLVASLLIASVPSPKAASEEAQVHWSKMYEGYEGRDIVQTFDGGYAMVGIAGSSGFIAKVDASGDQLWIKTYQIENSKTVFSRVIQTSDGGYIVAGERDVRQDLTDEGIFFFNVSELCMAKIDSQGDLEWNRTHLHDKRIAVFNVLNSFTQTKNGEYLLTGSYRTFPPTDVYTWLLLTDSAGNALLNKTLHGRIYGFYGTTVLEDSDKSIAVIGTTDTHGPSAEKFQIIKLDPNFNIQWNNTYGDYRNTDTGEDIHSNVNSAIVTNDEGYLIVGSSDFGIYDVNDIRKNVGWIVKTNQDGTMQWNKTYEEYKSVESIVQNLNGDYVFAGKTVLDQPWVTSIDIFGNILWDLKLPDWNANQENIERLILTNSGDYVVLNSNRNTILLSKITLSSGLLSPSPSPTSTPVPFPATFIVASIAIAAVVGAGLGLLLYLIKRK
jgi:hypothetical protein